VVNRALSRLQSALRTWLRRISLGEAVSALPFLSSSEIEEARIQRRGACTGSGRIGDWNVGLQRRREKDSHRTV
jgi:hypothetical protein